MLKNVLNDRIFQSYVSVSLLGIVTSFEAILLKETPLTNNKQTLFEWNPFPIFHLKTLSQGAGPKALLGSNALSRNSFVEQFVCGKGPIFYRIRAFQLARRKNGNFPFILNFLLLFRGASNGHFAN